MDLWRTLTGTLRASDPYRELLAGCRASAPVVSTRLPVPAAAWVTDGLRRDLGRPILALVPHEGDVLAWVQAATLVAGPEAALTFPAPALSPYQDSEQPLSVRAQEAVAVDRLLARPPQAPPPLVVATPRALFRLLPRPADVAAATLVLRRDADWPLDALIGHLLRHGYRRVDVVSEVGEVAVRGGLVDVFPPGESEPLRIELFGDTVESIRRFDATSQRSLDSEPEARLLPLGLFPAGPDEARALAGLITDGLGETPSSRREDREELLVALHERASFPGWESWLAVLAPSHHTLQELIAATSVSPAGSPAVPLVIAVDPPTLQREARQHAERLAADYELRCAHRRLALPPESIEHPLASVEAVLAAATVTVEDLLLDAPPALAAPAGPDRAADRRIDWHAAPTDLFHGQLPRFPTEVAAARARGERVVLLAPAGHHARLADLLANREIERGPGGVELVDGELERGMRLPAARVSLFAEGQLLPRGLVGRPPAKSRNPFLSALRDLKVGDFVVHAEHGIGQFVALRSVERMSGEDAHLPAPLRSRDTTAAASVEVMEISYAGGRRLLLPLTRIDQVQKYGGIEGVPPRLDQLGGASWSKTKAKVKAGLRQMADELVKLYAERQLATAPAMAAASDFLQQFVAAFPFEETADQLEAVDAIHRDLASSRPMDRLLCGDVGFGKTEVAMRAAMKAVDNGFQVAVLAPTTILADQHLETFRRRFAGLPVVIEMVSRIRSPAEMKDIRKRLAERKIDILIGTHRLLAKELEIPHLGLLVVDEEQRFGVAQKERLKQLKKNVHVLAMSATPVPRTLQLSLAGVRDLSVIETPPRDRMAVETAILGYNDQLVREAIEYELERGGQIYYVYNRVEGIEVIQQRLRELLPDLRITVGHGQMEEHELERRMHAFVRGDYDLLLATTIIENGIDIPNVNTMIVHHAERFGLAQLYQLRGRVGRSSQLGFCYLLVEQDRALSEQARKRLAALREFSDLGAGFRIAARDLEIRGAGNLLGAEQSGHIATVGIETYLELLEEAIRELRGEAVEAGPSTTVDLPVEAAIPTDYVPDASLRLELYRRIAEGGEDEAALLAELDDRFGSPPEAVRRLLALAGVKRVAERLRVQSIGVAAGKLQVRLRRDARIDVDRLLAMVTGRPGTAFSPSGVLTLELEGREPLPLLADTLRELAA